MLPRSSPLGSSSAGREIHIRLALYLRFDWGCSRTGEIKTKQGRRVLLNFLSFSFTPPGLQSLLGADARWRQLGSTGWGEDGPTWGHGDVGTPPVPVMGCPALPGCSQSLLVFLPLVVMSPLCKQLRSLAEETLQMSLKLGLNVNRGIKTGRCQGCLRCELAHRPRPRRAGEHPAASRGKQSPGAVRAEAVVMLAPSSPKKSPGGDRGGLWLSAPGWRLLLAW